jgi:biotin synthase
MMELKEMGVDSLVIPLDGATETVFDEIKGKEAGCPYTWEGHMRALSEAAEIFGVGNVGTHLIIGLGESEEDALRTVQDLSNMGVRIAFFAYTPVPSSQILHREKSFILREDEVRRGGFSGLWGFF